MHAYRLIFMLGGSIAAVYSRRPLLRDYDFASHRCERSVSREFDPTCCPLLLVIDEKTSIWELVADSRIRREAGTRGYTCFS
jgi:hypothetical protein